MTDSATNRNEGGSWRLRRNFMFATAVFCAMVITYVLWEGLDTRVAETAVTMAFVILGSTVSSYVFGAAWEDINSHKHGRSKSGGGRTYHASDPKSN